MRVVHLIGPHLDTGLQPLCGTWGLLDSDWTSVPREATCAACLAEMQLLIRGAESPKSAVRGDLHT